MAKIFICGDIVHLNHEGPFIGEKLSKIIASTDFAIGNLEGVELYKNEIPPQNPYQSPGSVDYLAKVGFALMLLSNNHITDLGSEHLRYTMDLIENSGMKHIGAGLSWEETYRPLIKEINGLRFGFVNICEAQTGQYVTPNQLYGYAWMGYNNLLEDIRNLSTKTDRVVVVVHAGLEHYPMPLPEIRDFYKRLCDVGASCVIGGHPHIAQGYEFYNDSFIAYSLGNFYFPHKKGIHNNENTSFSIILEMGNDGVIKPQFIHHTLDNNIVEIEEDINRQVHIEELCGLLGEGYEERADEMCANSYNTLCYKLLEESLCGDSERKKWKEIAKDIIKRTIFRKKFIINTQLFREQQLLRLFENETYRYTIIRALKNKLNK